MTRESVNTVWIGDAESGKTSLLTSYTQDIFPQEYVPTVFENYTAKVPALDGTEKMITNTQKPMGWKNAIGRTGKPCVDFKLATNMLISGLIFRPIAGTEG